jgi:hypothetical protein
MSYNDEQPREKLSGKLLPDQAFAEIHITIHSTVIPVILEAASLLAALAHPNHLLE